MATFAEALAEGGLAAVLAMQTSVPDRGATAFAEPLDPRRLKPAGRAPAGEPPDLC